MNLFQRIELCFNLLFRWDGTIPGYYDYDTVNTLRINDRFSEAFRPLSRIINDNIIILDEKIKNLEFLSKLDFDKFFDSTLPWTEQDSPQSEIKKIEGIKNKLWRDIEIIDSVYENDLSETGALMLDILDVDIIKIKRHIDMFEEADKNGTFHLITDPEYIWNRDDTPHKRLIVLNKIKDKLISDIEKLEEQPK